MTSNRRGWCHLTDIGTLAIHPLTLHDFELTTARDAPHDADVVTTSCSARPSVIPSVMIITIEGYRSTS